MSAARVLPRLPQWGLRVALAAVYLYAGLAKIADPLAFARAIWNYRLLPAEAIMAVALVLPIWEVLVAAGVLAGVFYRGSLLTVLGMSLAFTAAIASATLRGIDLECGCFGASVNAGAGWAHVAFNLATAAAAGWLLARSGRSYFPARTSAASAKAPIA